jgi:hypothetical protein
MVSFLAGALSSINSDSSEIVFDAITSDKGLNTVAKPSNADFFKKSLRLSDALSLLSLVLMISIFY